MKKDIAMMGSGLLAMVAIVGAVYSAVDWHIELKDKQTDIAQSVQQLQQSRELDVIWQLDRKWSTYGLTVAEHQQWCFLRKKHSLPPCPGRLKK